MTLFRGTPVAAHCSSWSHRITYWSLRLLGGALNRMPTLKSKSWKKIDIIS